MPFIFIFARNGDVLNKLAKQKCLFNSLSQHAKAMSTIEQKVKEVMGCDMPPAAKPIGSYVACKCTEIDFLLQDNCL